MMLRNSVNSPSERSHPNRGNPEFDRGRATERVAENPGSKRRLAITWTEPMPKLSQNWSVPFSPRVVLCCAIDSSTGLARITSSHPRGLGFTSTELPKRTVDALGEPTGIVIIID